MKIFQASSFWFFLFSIIFLLSLDFWSWKQGTSLLFFQLPSWLFYFVLLQIILTIALLIFAHKFWKTPMEKEND